MDFPPDGSVGEEPKTILKKFSRSRDRPRLKRIVKDMKKREFTVSTSETAKSSVVDVAVLIILLVVLLTFQTPRRKIQRTLDYTQIVFTSVAIFNINVANVARKCGTGLISVSTSHRFHTTPDWESSQLHLPQKDTKYSFGEGLLKLPSNDSI